MSEKLKTLIVILGPTAIGKTTIAIDIAQCFNSEIISADARQFYREMNIGTAKPSAEELKKVKHHLINSLSVKEDYDVSRFEKDALHHIESIFADHDIAILVGGSGLYINAVCNGLDQLPPSESELRLELQKTFNEKGIEALQKQLKVLDPEYHSQVDLHNPHRVIRGIEVCLLTGKKYSSYRTKEKITRPFKIIKAGINTSRDKLYERINARVDEMIANGLVDEVKSLLPYRNYNSLNTVGYKEIFEYLEASPPNPLSQGAGEHSEVSMKYAIDKIKQNTRNYVKRQLTWFKRDEEIQWFELNQKEEIVHWLNGSLV